MIISVFIYIIALIFGMIGGILPDFQVLPSAVFLYINNLVSWTLELNSIFFFIDNLLNAFVFFLKFLNYFLLYKLAIMVINYFRGAKGIS